MKMSNEKDVIASMMKGYEKTNLVDMNLAENEDIIKRVSLILQRSPDKHTRNSSIGFDPVQNQLLKKMVDPIILDKKVKAIKTEYFKCILYIDFYTNYIVQGSEILDSIRNKSKELEKVHDFLDPNLELFIRCCSLDYLSRFNPVSSRDRRRTFYTSNNPQFDVSYSSFRRTDPFYEAASKLFLNQFSDGSLASRIETVDNRNDLSSLLFIDMNMDLYKNQSSERGYKRAESQINPLLDKEEYFKAAHLSMEIVSRKVSRQPLSAFIKTMKPTRY